MGGDLRDALGRVLGIDPTITVAGRTDAGVHARRQVVSFDAPTGSVEPHSLRRSVNAMLDQVIAWAGALKRLREG